MPSRIGPRMKDTQTLVIPVREVKCHLFARLAVKGSLSFVVAWPSEVARHMPSLTIAWTFLSLIHLSWRAALHVLQFGLMGGW